MPFISGSCRLAGWTLYFIARPPGREPGDIISLTFAEAAHHRAVNFLATAYSAAAMVPAAAVERQVRQLCSDYLTGGRQYLAGPGCSLFFDRGTAFQKGVWGLIARIPYGETRTYGELAKDLGKPLSARAVGQACHANPLAVLIPCHRIISARTIGGFAGGVAVKARLLALEKHGNRLYQGGRGGQARAARQNRPNS